MPTMRDAYELLGLAPGVTPTDVKRAFRRLAMRWHPDRNPAPAAAEHFKALRRAHDKLLAGLKPADASAEEHGHADPAASGQDTDAPADAETAPRGADRSMDLELDLEEAFLGGTRQICLSQASSCTHCSGTGEIRLTFTRLCEPCRGSGKVRNGKGLQSCTACAGRGYRSTAACPDCEGSGQQTSERWLAVSLPAGLVDGDSLRLSGEGEPHPEHSGKPGDLHLRIRLNAHPLYTRKGRDLLLQRPISALRLLLGGTVPVPHPGGPRKVTIPAGSASARQVRFDGEGFPARAGRPAGDMVIDFQPLMPTQVDTALHAQFEALEAELQRGLGQYLPELAAWEAKWMQNAGR